MSEPLQAGILPDAPEMDAPPSLAFRVQSEEPISSMPILDSAEAGRLRLVAALMKAVIGSRRPLGRLASAEELRRVLVESDRREAS